MTIKRNLLKSKKFKNRKYKKQSFKLKKKKKIIKNGGSNQQKFCYDLFNENLFSISPNCVSDYMFLMPGQERVDDEGDGRTYDFKTGVDFYRDIKSQNGIIPKIKVANYGGNYTYISSGDEGSIWKYDVGTQPKIIKLPIYDKTSHPETLEEIKKFINEFSEAEFNKFDTISKEFEQSDLLNYIREHTSNIKKIDIKLINTTLIDGKISNNDVKLISRPYYSIDPPTPMQINRIKQTLSKAEIHINDITEDNVIKTGKNEYVIIDFNQV